MKLHVEYISITLQAQEHLVVFAENFAEIMKSSFGVTFQLCCWLFLSLAATESTHSYYQYLSNPRLVSSLSNTLL